MEGGLKRERKREREREKKKIKEERERISYLDVALGCLSLFIHPSASSLPDPRPFSLTPPLAPPSIRRSGWKMTSHKCMMLPTPLMSPDVPLCSCPPLFLLLLLPFLPFLLSQHISPYFSMHLFFLSFSYSPSSPLLSVFTPLSPATSFVDYWCDILVEG